MSGLVCADDVITRDEMHPSIYEYPKPLVCQFYTGEADNRVLGEKFILTWAQLVEIGQYTMVFRKDGKDYVVPAGSGYICNALAG